eukprot:Polyplicarium_translucidae@DN1177_c0_g1_i1.p1
MTCMRYHGCTHDHEVPIGHCWAEVVQVREQPPSSHVDAARAARHNTRWNAAVSASGGVLVQKSTAAITREHALAMSNIRRLGEVFARWIAIHATANAAGRCGPCVGYGQSLPGFGSSRGRRGSPPVSMKG